MSRYTASVVILLISMVSTADAFALGSDFSKDQLREKGELVQGQTPVHGYWVNWEDTFFYAGETADLNRFLNAYAQLTGATRRVVIHPGTRKARSPWDAADRDIPNDWSFYRWNAGRIDHGKPAPSRVDVWLGSRIKLDELRIPAEVEVASGGEIERFVEQRQKQAAEDCRTRRSDQAGGEGFRPRGV